MKFVIDKYIKAKNTLKRYLSIDLPVFIPYFPKRSILDKEEGILKQEEEIFFPKIKGMFGKDVRDSDRAMLPTASNKGKKSVVLDDLNTPADDELSSAVPYL